MSGSSAVAAAAASSVLVETSHDLPLVSLTISSKNGAIYDPRGLEGLTRLSARLMRRTAGGRDPQEIDARIDALGGSLGMDVSASATSLQAMVIRRSLDAFVEIVAEVLEKPGLAEAELGRLSRETQADLLESLDDDRGLAGRWFRRKLFAGHPYARSVSGTVSTLSKITQPQVAERARQLAQRDQLLFAFSGDIEPSEASRIRQQIIDRLPAGSVGDDPTPDPTPIPGRRLVLVDKPDRTQTQILIGGLGSHASDPDHTALSVGNTIFGGTFTARMTQEVRSKRGWSYGAYSSLPLDRRRQAFSMWTFPKAEDAGPCIALQLDMLHELRNTGVTKKELAWAKRYLVRSHAFAVDTPAKRVGLALETALYDLPRDYYENYLARIGQVTLEEINQALVTRLPEDDLLVVVVGTASALRSQVEASISNLKSTEVIPYDSE